MSGGNKIGPKIITDGLILYADSNNEKSHADINYSNILEPEKWAVGTGSDIGFSRNGQSIENSRELGTSPFGNDCIIWKAIPDAVSDGDGGWITSPFNIDNTKLYRFSVWINREVHGTNGYNYLGMYGYGSPNGVQNVSNGATESNPYFYIPNYNTLPENEWVLLVGHVYPYTHTGTSIHPDSGRYTINGGKLGSVSKDFKWLVSTTLAAHRTYLYYCTDTTVRTLWYHPRVDIVDGTEPSIQNLLDNKTRGVTSLFNTQYTSELINYIKYNSVNKSFLLSTSGYLQTNFGDGFTFNTTNKLTICAWVASSQTTVSAMWMDWGGNGTDQRFYASINSGSTIRSGIQNSPWAGGIPPDTNWHYQTIIMDGSNAKFYDNGEYVGQKAYTSYIIEGNLRFGGRNYQSYNWDGYIASVKIYNRELSVSEIKQNYDNTKLLIVGS